MCFCTVDTGKLVNRGFLNGPVCPIYGFGMVLVLAILTPVQHSGLALFLSHTGRYCTKCGREAGEDDAYCAGCGAKLADK